MPLRVRYFNYKRHFKQAVSVVQKLMKNHRVCTQLDWRCLNIQWVISGKNRVVHVFDMKDRQIKRLRIRYGMVRYVSLFILIKIHCKKKNWSSVH